MSPCWGRIIGYVCLSFALGLAIPPLFQADRRSETVTHPVVFLTAVALNSKALAPACKAEPLAISDAYLDQAPLVKAAVARLLKQGPQEGGVQIFSRQPAALAERLGQGQAGSFCFAYGGQLYLLRPHIVQGDNRAAVWVAGVQTPRPDLAKALGREDLADYPALAGRLAELDELSEKAIERYQRAQRQKGQAARPTKEAVSDHERAAQAWRQIEESARANHEWINDLRDQSRFSPYYRRSRLDMPPERWHSLMKSLGNSDNWQAFTYGGYLFIGQVEQLTETVEVLIGGAFWGRVIAAGLLFILGLWVMRRAYLVGPGIRLNPQWAAVFADTVFILAAAFGAYCIVDLAMADLLGALAQMDEAVQAVCALMYLPSLVFMAVFAARLACQTLEITPAAVIRHGPGGRRMLPWESVQGFELQDTHVLVGRVGILIPRKLQTMLVIKAEEGDVAVVEPGLRAIKEKVVGELGKMVPPRLQNDIQRLSRDW